MDMLKLKSAGLSARKASYLRSLAAALKHGTLNPAEFASMDDSDIRKSLTALPGIGSWTADMFLIFALKRQDIFPCEDLGIRRGLIHYLEIKDTASNEILRGKQNAYLAELAEKWKPYRSAASLQMWKIAKTLPPSRRAPAKTKSPKPRPAPREDTPAKGTRQRKNSNPRGPAAVSDRPDRGAAV